MMLRTLVVGALFVVWGCAESEPLSPIASDAALFERAPANGNGNKIVDVVDFDWPDPTPCPSGATLTLHIVGWLQDRPGSDPPDQPGIVSFYFEFTYSNAAGETYVWHQLGVGNFRFNESGDLIVAFAGRTLDNIGRMVINLTTGEVESMAGRASVGESLACAALT
jgi:hypothetical protein